MHVHIPVHMCICTHIEREKEGWEDQEGDGRREGEMEEERTEDKEILLELKERYM